MKTVFNKVLAALLGVAACSTDVDKSATTPPTPSAGEWDIAIHSMDPRLVKLLKPGAFGLTSRRQDKDTGEMTSQGNMKLDSAQKAVLAHLEASQAAVRADGVKQVIKATEMAGYEVKRTKKGSIAEDI